MMWNFDEPVEREGTNCIKYDLREEIFGEKDIIPMWVADMDFKTPDFVTSALRDQLKHEIFGYSFRPPEYYSSIIEWLKRAITGKLKKNGYLLHRVLFRHLISVHWHLHSPETKLLFSLLYIFLSFQQLNPMDEYLFITSLRKQKENGKWILNH